MAKLVGLYTEPRVVVEHPGYFDALLDTSGGRTSTDGGDEPLTMTGYRRRAGRLVLVSGARAHGSSAALQGGGL